MRKPVVNTFARLLIGALALGLGATAQAGSWSGTQSIGGMDVWIYTPDSTASNGKRSAMLVLHGCAQKGSDLRDGGNLEEAAEAYGMVIATPNAPNGGVGMYKCYDYYGANHTRTNRHNGPLIALGKHLAARPDVDAKRVYIAGLSSGATQAQVTGCLAPDVFSGVGSTGGPTMGTADSQAFVFGGSAEEAARLCKGWAGSNVGLLKTQLWNIAHGSSDGLVPFKYADQNIRAVGLIKGISKTGTGTQPGATEEIWGQSKDATLLVYTGMDHRWAAGGDTGGGTYIDHSTSRINYAKYLAKYFKEAGNVGPEVENLKVARIAARISASAKITDAQGSVKSARALVYNALTEKQVRSFEFTASGGGVYVGESNGLPDGLYRVDVTATDNEGLAGNTASATVRIGPKPADAKPILRADETVISVSGQCATIGGRVVDVNQDLRKVVVKFATGNVTATVNGTRYEAKQCGLPGGDNSARIIATDKAGNSRAIAVQFKIDAGVTATLSEHISGGRLDYATGYGGACYSKYSTNAFKLTKKPEAGQCRWVDADASCKGPLVACGTVPGDDEPQPGGDCEAATTTNTAHAAAGRAAQQYGLLYYAAGSNAYLGMGTATTTLHSDDGKTWSLGSCP